MKRMLPVTLRLVGPAMKTSAHLKPLTLLSLADELPPRGSRGADASAAAMHSRLPSWVKDRPLRCGLLVRLFHELTFANRAMRLPFVDRLP